MACSKCNFLGVIAAPFFQSAGTYVNFRMCPHCRDVTAYSAFVQARYKVAQVVATLSAEEREPAPVYEMEPHRVERSQNPFKYGIAPVLSLDAFRRRRTT
jgi:hypothetical protein